MTALTFAPATKEQAKARVALAGPSGSGKTWTSLTIASVLGDRIAFIDTERGSASKYADEFAFDTLQLTSYEPQLLVDALATAGNAAYPVVVVDSMSHFWSGLGGMLEQVDAAAKRSGGGNNFAGWKEARPMERKMVDALLAYPGHVIVTMRTKTEYIVETDGRGKSVPRKVGLKPEQRDGIEYEFDIVGDLDLENTLTISKSRARILSGRLIPKPGQEFADEIATWLGDGKPAPTAADFLVRATDDQATHAELLDLYQEVKRARLLAAAVTDETGETVTLDELIKRRGREARAAEAKAVEQPAPAPAPEPEPASEEQPAADASDGEPMISRAQLTKLHTVFSTLGVTDRDERLTIAGGIVDRPLDTSQELTQDEARTLIDELEKRAAKADEQPAEQTGAAS